MTIERLSLFNTENIGVYARANNSCVFVPAGLGRMFSELIGSKTGIDTVELELGGISATGIMIACNDNGVILPYNASEEAVSAIRNRGLNYHVSKSRVNALGNLLAANSKVCFASPILGHPLLKAVEDTLDVEVVATTVAGLTTVGSSLALNNKGFVCNPETSDEEFELIKNRSGLSGSRVTVNGGYPYVRSGMVFNDHFVLVGKLSTGVELAEIESGLGLV
ncbi:MAG: translation initiation factor IF-6 [Thermoprotei archaeon]